MWLWQTKRLCYLEDQKPFHICRKKHRTSLFRTEHSSVSKEILQRSVKSIGVSAREILQRSIKMVDVSAREILQRSVKSIGLSAREILQPSVKMVGVGCVYAPTTLLSYPTLPHPTYWIHDKTQAAEACNWGKSEKMTILGGQNWRRWL